MPPIKPSTVQAGRAESRGGRDACAISCPQRPTDYGIKCQDPVWGRGSAPSRRVKDPPPHYFSQKRIWWRRLDSNLRRLRGVRAACRNPERSEGPCVNLVAAVGLEPTTYGL